MDNNFIVGKYTLESLTNGMYSNPLDLLREYIQNSVDSIDFAIENYANLNCKYCIEIEIDTTSKNLKIIDNGAGISNINAFKTLLDIGNSQKDLRKSRGFRGIGRLSGLGYCDKLIFTTSYFGETDKSIVTFDAKKLKELLLPGQHKEETLSEVLNQVVSCSTAPEKSKEHYFRVEMFNLKEHDGLLNSQKVSDYLIQNMPLPYNKHFRFGEIIKAKIESLGYLIPSYEMTLNIDGKKQLLFKPYEDCLVSDRVKHVEEPLQDIEIKKFYNGNVLSAILWYGKSGYNGTILNSQVKGIRLRKGNLLVGDNTTLNKFFKEERFNGWLIGEIFVLDDNVIPNSRRDNFEQNAAYLELMNQVQEWTIEISKQIRKASYVRNLDANEQKIIDSDDTNNLLTEDTSFCDDELTLMEFGESYEIAQSDYLDKLALLLGKKEKQTKYSALNINTNLTFEQRKLLERVFDILLEEYPEENVKDIIETVAKKF